MAARPGISARLSTGGTARLRDRVLVIAAAIVVALIAWAIARLLIGDPLRVESGDGEGTVTIGPGPVIFVTLIGGLLGWAALALLERFTGQARRIWLILAVIALAFSMLGVLQAIGTGTTIALITLHIVVGLVLIAGMLRTVRDRPA